MKDLDYQENARSYYGEVLQGSSDLKTSACCPAKAPPARLREALARLPDEVLARFYGCGSPLPEALEGCTVLDLGCGTGRDVFVAAQLVGPEGRVIGVDLTDNQLAVARRHAEPMRQRFGLPEGAIRFEMGNLENLAAIGIEDASVDVVISNCVLNLAADKGAALAEIFRVLKPGGELYFSDVFASRRLPHDLRNDPVFHGECLGGAWYWEDFRRLLSRLGVPDYRVIERHPLALEDERMRQLSAGIRFESATVRAFKLSDLEDRCEDYGQIVTYRGSVSSSPVVFELDPGHKFERGRPERVCGNSAAMIEGTRLARHFDVLGNRSHHFGLFDCGAPGAGGDAGPVEGSCC